jgi:hypothetical protein
MNVCSETPLRSVLFALALPLSSANVVFAQHPPPFQLDGTVFVGPTMVPTARRSVGFAFGGGGSAVRYEIEYASSVSDPAKSAPSVHTAMANLLVQSGGPIPSVRFYGTAGFGFYGESFENGRGNTDTGTNVGGGAKITLAGPLRLRLDYRGFFFRGTAAHSKPQRLYAGINLGF